LKSVEVCLVVRSAAFWRLVSVAAALVAIVWTIAAYPQAQAPTSKPVAGLQIVLLGTGTPRPVPEQQGPSLAIVVNGKAYLVDSGTGVVRQANAAFTRGVSGLQPAALEIAFLTHLHSDHTLGLPDLILTPWIYERTKPLQLYGPEGTQAMAAHLLEAYAEDIRVRTTGLEGGNATGYKVDAHDIKPGVVYRDANVVVTAFQVKHGSWKEALGYRFDAGGKSVVVSGDTAPAESLIAACNGCDALIHEAYAGRGTNAAKPSLTVEQWMKYESEFHTSATELGDIAARAKAKMLIVTHWTLLGNVRQDEMVGDIRRGYKGPVTIGRDLDYITP
jgi:ribonuclease BN (tRNA processing enzyme)